MSDTPRTDALIYRKNTLERQRHELLDLALALERELAEAKAQRPWVGLTDREFQPMIQKAMAYYGYDQSEPSHLTAGAGFRVFAYAIEAKLREKNGG